MYNLNCKIFDFPERPVKDVRLGLYAKKTYSPPVKVHDWQVLASKLEDTVSSHQDVDYSTETKSKYVWSNTKRWINFNKKMTNICSYKDDTELDQAQENFIPEHCEDYVTSMQAGYSPPYPYAMQRISMPSTPYFLNRFLNKPTTMSTLKFFDDENSSHTCRLQKYRQVRHKSWNPWLGVYNDGSK
ncbi:unnamed protein product [Brassicogethes aeneus]|uniref:Uncharacterized protein n=1 Tax=Brassicogethes aeneus TaxID=1431903 RepID=A0A9P0BA57_BRAAE|nr:unnamed protein product [Brassicogethes aeneus]